MNANYFPSILLIKTLKTFCFLLVISFSSSSYGQDVKNHLGTSSPGSGTLEIPAGVGMSGNLIKVQTWGAGGGGGGPATLLGLLNVLNVGGGGGGGAFNEGMLNNVGADPDNVKIAYTIGAAGAGGTPTTIDGKNGGKSFFSTVSANGGKGGAAGILLGGILNLYASNGIGGQGGQGGSFSGGDGFTAGLLGQGLGLVSGGGGGGAGSGGDGKGSNVDLLSQTGGAGGIANGADGGTGGKGGDGLTASNLTHGNGLPGGFPAGGGGGSITVLEVLGVFGRPTGGNGGNGQIKVTYTCPVYTVSNVTADNVCVSPGTTVVTLNGFLPMGKYTVNYDVSSPSHVGLQAVNVKATTAGALKFTVSGLTTVGTSRITIKSIKSVDCLTTISGKYVDVTVNPNLVASVAITASSSGAICYGTPVTFTATPTHGGTAPVYQWRVNGVNVAGANSITYTNSTLKNADIVTCVMTSNATPCLTGNPATSNPISMAIAGPEANSVTVCKEGSGSLTASGCVDGSPIPSTNKAISIANEVGGSSWTINNSTGTASSEVSIAIIGNKSVTTKNLQATTFGFAIPSNATITGIKVAVNRYSGSSGLLASNYVKDDKVQLIKTSGVLGTNKAVTDSNWSTTNTTIADYGGTSDLWGTSWTPAEINSPDFGVALAVYIHAAGISLGSVTTTATVNSIKVTVTYYIPNPVNWYKNLTGGTPIFSGASFNPVVVHGSGLADTSTPGIHTYYAACSTNPVCRTPVNFIISDKPTIAAIPAQAVLCSGGILNPIIPVVNAHNSVINAFGWQLETAVGSGIYANLTVPYTVSFADNGKRIRYYVSTSCTPATYSNVVPITVNSIPAPVIGIPTEPNCKVSIASVTISNLSGSWTINATPNVGLTGLTHNGTATATVSGLTSGTTYNFTVSNGSCTSAVFPVVVKKLPVKTWNGTAWSPDPTKAPTIDEKVIFESDYNINTSVTACSCEVKAGAVVVFNSGYYLKLRNELIVDSEGLLTFENNASLVQMNDDAVNEGIISYKRNTTPVNRYDYTYWSSPVVGMTLKQLSPGTFYDKYFKYHNTWVSIIRETAMNIGEGYIVRAPQIIAISGNPAEYPAVFKGMPHNGEVKKELSPNRDYLLGNPYPSAISADAFLIKNQTKLHGTLYFWTHNSPPNEDIDGDKKYNYTANDYATYNGTGGTATRAAIPDSNFNYPDINSSIPTGNIAAGQGFFAPASATGGEVIFNNEMRLTANAVINNTQFFKLEANSKLTNVIEKNRVWLNLSNSEGAFKQTLVGYITGATNDYEGSFDGISYDGNTFVDFYSLNNDVNLSIQGRALPFQQKDSVALGYRSAIKGKFQISIDQKDGKLANQQVFLEDKLVQVLHDLKRPYSFETEVGIFNDRFVLRYEDKNAIIEDIVDTPVSAVSISTKDKNIKLTTTESVIDKVYIYDFSGGLVYSDSEINATATVVSNLLIDHSPLIVHVVLENGKKTVKKIMY